MKPIYEVMESREFPDHWHCEAIEQDGSVSVAVFSGPDAEKRAREYADWKNMEVGTRPWVARLEQAHRTGRRPTD